MTVPSLRNEKVTVSLDDRLGDSLADTADTPTYI
jgi:hypothetical protein